MPNKPSYTLHLDSSPVKTYSNTYRRKSLEEMTTYQLRDICTKEKIIKGITDPLNRYELIETILRYRGEREALLIRREAEGGMDRLSNLLFRKMGTCLRDEGTIHNPARLVLYNGLDLSLYDKYQVGIDRSKRNDISKVVINHLVESNVLLVGEDNGICTILNLVSDGADPEGFFLERDGSQPVRLSDHKAYYLMFFEKKESDILYRVYYKAYGAVLPH